MPSHVSSLSRVVFCTLLAGSSLAAQHQRLYPVERLEVGSVPQGVAVADLDGNGTLDIVTANVSSGDVSVLLSGCPGIFPPAGLPYTNDVPQSLTYPAGSSPFAVVTTDVDGDGVPDIVVANSSSKDVTILGGVGDGTFVHRQTILIGAGTPRDLEAALMNTDTHIDLVIGSPNGDTVAVLLNDGTGTFGLSSLTSAPGTLHGMAVGDLNGDGRPDVATAHFQGDALAVYLNDGTGQLAAPVSIPVPDPVNVDIGFVDLDGHADLVTATFAGISYFPGNSTGTFTTSVDSPVLGFGTEMQLFDFDDDGLLDVGVAHHGDEQAFAIAHGTGAGSFESPVEYPVGIAPDYFVATDIDDDGDVDVVLVDAGADAVAILHAKEPGVYAGGKVLDLPMDGDDRPHLRVADVNSDGDDDLVMAWSSSVRVALGDGAGVFTTHHDGFIRGFATGLCVGHIDAGSALDAVVLDLNDNSVQVLLGDGSGGLGLATSYPIGSVPSKMILADIDADGFDDVVTASRQSQLITIFLADGLGGLGAPISIPLLASPESIVSGRLNADSHLDLAVATTDHGGLFVIFGTGTGAFSPPLSLEPMVGVSLASRGVTLGDMDADGDLDIVSDVDARVGVLVNNGAAMFSLPAAPVFAGNGPHDEFTIVDDIDDDGFLDVLGTRKGSAAITVLLSDGDNGFREVHQHSMCHGSYPNGGAASLEVGDFDGDGLARDILVGVARPTRLMALMFQGSDDPWRNEGARLQGTTAPRLVGWGSLEDSSHVRVCLTDALPSSMTTLIVGLSRVDLPFKGGVLVPAPDTLIGPLLVGVDGRLLIESTWPAGAPADFPFYYQHWIVDALGPNGVAASNAISGTTPP